MYKFSDRDKLIVSYKYKLFKKRKKLLSFYNEVINNCCDYAENNCNNSPDYLMNWFHAFLICPYIINNPDSTNQTNDSNNCV